MWFSPTRATSWEAPIASVTPSLLETVNPSGASPGDTNGSELPAAFGAAAGGVELEELLDKPAGQAMDDRGRHLESAAG